MRPEGKPSTCVSAASYIPYSPSSDRPYPLSIESPLGDAAAATTASMSSLVHETTAHSHHDLHKQAIPRILQHGRIDGIAGWANRSVTRRDMALCTAARAGSRCMRLENANRERARIGPVRGCTEVEQW